MFVSRNPGVSCSALLSINNQNMKTIICWRLESVSDSGPNFVVARFESRQAAEDAKPCAGGYGPTIIEERIQIFESAIEFNPRLNSAAAASGLAKLTDEEKKALGIDA